jgi:translation initiation factor IF-1
VLRGERRTTDGAPSRAAQAKHFKVLRMVPPRSGVCGPSQASYTQPWMHEYCCGSVQIAPVRRDACGKPAFPECDRFRRVTWKMKIGAMRASVAVVPVFGRVGAVVTKDFCDRPPRKTHWRAALGRCEPFQPAPMRLCSGAMKEAGMSSMHDGVVRELNASGFYRVVLDGGHEVIARKNGAISKHRIVVAAGDKVRVEVSSYDTLRRRIIFRYR